MYSAIINIYVVVYFLFQVTFIFLLLHLYQHTLVLTIPKNKRKLLSHYLFIESEKMLASLAQLWEICAQNHKTEMKTFRGRMPYTRSL